MKNLFLAIAAAAFILACQNQSKSTETENSTAQELSFEINETLKNELSPPETFTVSAVKGTAIKTKDGSRITIPADAFVDKDGKAIEGDVKVEYQPITGVSNIIASGIPMVYETKGEVQSFVSDGMFEFNASTADGQEVSIAKNKAIDIHMPSKDSKSDFDFWYFNEDQGKWENIGSRTELSTDAQIDKTVQEAGVPQVEAAKQEIALVKKTKAPAKKKPSEYNPNKPVIDIDFDEEQLPELSNYSQFVWQYAGKDAKQDPHKNKWVLEGDWEDMALEPVKGQKFLFNLAFNVNGTPFKTVVTPALSGEDYKKAVADFNKEMSGLQSGIQEIKTKVKNGKADAEAQNILYNSFRVSKMGIYNCDRFYSDPTAEEFQAEFLFNNKKLSDDQSIYIVLNDKKEVIQYNARTYKLKIKPKLVNGIITVAGGGAVAAVAPEYIEEFRQRKGGKIKLLFKKIKSRLTSRNNIDDIIADL